MVQVLCRVKSTYLQLCTQCSPFVQKDVHCSTITVFKYRAAVSKLHKGVKNISGHLTLTSLFLIRIYRNWSLLQIDFTALALQLNTSDSAAKQKWLDVMRKENDKMVCCTTFFRSSLPSQIMALHWRNQSAVMLVSEIQARGCL